MFDDFIREGSVKRISPDIQLAKSLIKISEARMRNIEAFAITDENSFMIIENCYEAIRELSDALLAIRGFKSYSHEADIEFLKDYYSIKLSFGNINRADKYRVLKNTKEITKILKEIAEAEMKKKQ